MTDQKSLQVLKTDASLPWKENTADKFHGIFIYNLPFFQGKFSRPPYVLVSSEHTYANRNHDAATVWAENVEVGKFTICSREMQNFDGLHEDIIVVSSVATWQTLDTFQCFHGCLGWNFTLSFSVLIDWVRNLIPRTRLPSYLARLELLQSD